MNNHNNLILSQCKMLVYFRLAPNLLQKEVDHNLKPTSFALLVYHNHYPSIYYEQLYKHFKRYFPQGTNKNQIRVESQGKQIPSDLPIGLYVQPNTQVTIKLDALPFMDTFRIILRNWKAAYTIINQNNGCDYIYKRLDEEQQKKLFQQYCQGKSHGMHNQTTYQGSNLIVRIFYQDFYVQRKTFANSKCIEEYIDQEFDLLLQKNNNIKLHVFGIELNRKITLKDLLQDWNYNDGYCYITMK